MFLHNILSHDKYDVSSLITQAELIGNFFRLTIWARTCFTLRQIVCCDTCVQLCFMESRAHHE